MSSDKQKISQRIAHFIDTNWADKQSRKITESTPFTSSPNIKFTEFPEAIIRYNVVGNVKLTLIFATDPPIVIEQDDELLKHLENDFLVIIFELPGFGFSLPRKQMSKR